jgi:hypothetical protein
MSASAGKFLFSDLEREKHNQLWNNIKGMGRISGAKSNSLENIHDIWILKSQKSGKTLPKKLSQQLLHHSLEEGDRSHRQVKSTETQARNLFNSKINSQNDVYV